MNLSNSSAVWKSGYSGRVARTHKQIEHAISDRIRNQDKFRGRSHIGDLSIGRDGWVLVPVLIITRPGDAAARTGVEPITEISSVGRWTIHHWRRSSNQ